MVPEFPVKVIVGVAAPLHTAVVPAIAAPGAGFTVTTVLPAWFCEHVVELASCTLTKA